MKPERVYVHRRANEPTQRRLAHQALDRLLDGRIGRWPYDVRAERRAVNAHIHAAVEQEITR